MRLGPELRFTGALCLALFGSASAAAQPAGGAAPVAPPPAAAAGAAATPGAPLDPATPEAAPTPATEGEAPKAEAVAAPIDQASSDTRAAAVRRYHAALAQSKLAPTAALSTERLRDELALVEDKILAGRRDEAIGDLVYLVESPRFDAFARSAEGRAAIFLLGDSLGRAGAYEPARGYLVKLLEAPPEDPWYRRAVHSLVDLALESESPEQFVPLLERVPPSAPEEVRGDVAYLWGRVAERTADLPEALAAYGRVSERSRFWAQATYLAGVIEVDRRNFKRGEELFCRVADPKRTPKHAALFGGGDFFRVRDLARLGLGRVAHEQYRFDDARYYYYLIPNDSERLPEALYETATTRYEAKDYTAAAEALEDLDRLGVDHVYQDEAWILGAYVDLAVCRFPEGDAKLTEFLRRYEPARDAAKRLIQDDVAMRRLVEAVRRGTDPAGAGLGVSDGTARALGALLRVDVAHGNATRRIAQLDHQLRGLLGAMRELDEASQKLSKRGDARPQSNAGLGERPLDKFLRIESQIADLRRLIRQAERAGGRKAEDAKALRGELEGLEIRSRALEASLAASIPAETTGGTGVADLVAQDRARATELYAATSRVRAEVEKRQLALARDAFDRLSKRLTRLLNRARLGRIETVLGKKRALELEVEALTKGLLPQTIIDSLRAERFLQDDEEYWPFEGEDWEDEYVGGEGLR